MYKDLKVSIVMTTYSALLVLGLSACGASTAPGQNTAELKVTFAGHRATPTVVADLHDAQAIRQLYTAALALPPPHGTVFSCPADDGSVYHLTFSGSGMTVDSMDVKASGCPFLTLTETNDLRWMDSTFIALFTSTIGVPTRDPSFP